MVRPFGAFRDLETFELAASPCPGRPRIRCPRDGRTTRECSPQKGRPLWSTCSIAGEAERDLEKTAVFVPNPQPPREQAAQIPAPAAIRTAFDPPVKDALERDPGHRVRGGTNAAPADQAGWRAVTSRKPRASFGGKSPCRTSGARSRPFGHTTVPASESTRTCAK